MLNELFRTRLWFILNRYGRCFTSSTTVLKNRQVVSGPVGFGAQGVEIGFECSLLDPSATEGRDVLRVAARTL